MFGSGHMVYEISSGVFMPEVCPHKDFKYDKIPDENVRNFVKFIFSVHAKKSPQKAVEQVVLLIVYYIYKCTGQDN